MRHLAAAGLGEPADGRGAHVGGLPVPGVGGAAEDPHRDDDHHLQEDLRQPRHPVEVGAKLNIPLHSSNPFSEKLALAAAGSGYATLNVPRVKTRWILG